MQNESSGSATRINGNCILVHNASILHYIIYPSENFSPYEIRLQEFSFDVYLPHLPTAAFSAALSHSMLGAKLGNVKNYIIHTYKYFINYKEPTKKRKNLNRKQKLAVPLNFI